MPKLYLIQFNSIVFLFFLSNIINNTHCNIIIMLLLLLEHVKIVHHNSSICCLNQSGLSIFFSFWDCPEDFCASEKILYFWGLFCFIWEICKYVFNSTHLQMCTSPKVILYALILHKCKWSYNNNNNLCKVDFFNLKSILVGEKIVAKVAKVSYFHGARLWIRLPCSTYKHFCCLIYRVSDFLSRKVGLDLAFLP